MMRRRPTAPLPALCAAAALLALGLAMVRPARAQNYTITDLGILPEKTATVLYGTRTVNNAGQTAGFCNLGDINDGLYADLNQGNVAFLWTPQDGIQQLPFLPGKSFASGWTLNDRKQVVGQSGNGPNDGRPVLWEKGTVRDLGLLPDDNVGLAYAINNRGQIVGYSSQVEGGVGAVRGFPTLWEKGQIVSLPVGDYPGGRCTAINQRGQIVGVVHTGRPDDFLFQSLPALWEDNGNRLRVLGTLGGDFGTAWDINDREQVVGYSQASDGTIRGYIWERGVMRDPGGRGGSFTALYAINNRGQAVGESFDADGVDHAILIDGDAVIDLNDRIPAGSGWMLLFGSGINERGQISGTGFLNGQVRSFLLTPRGGR